MKRKLRVVAWLAPGPRKVRIFSAFKPTLLVHTTDYPFFLKKVFARLYADSDVNIISCHFFTERLLCARPAVKDSQSFFLESMSSDLPTLLKFICNPCKSILADFFALSPSLTDKRRTAKI